MFFTLVNADCCFPILTGLREWFSQSDERHTAPRIPVMINMTSASVSSQKNQENQEPAGKGFPSLDELHSASRNSMMLDEFSDEDEEFQVAEVEQEVYIPLSSVKFYLLIEYYIFSWIGFSLFQAYNEVEQTG